MKSCKNDFPIFKNNKNLVYLDSAATSQKPKIVIDAISNYYKTYNANIHRGLYSLSEKATEKVEETRKKVAKFINAKDSSEIIFVRNTTEAINLVAYAWGRKNVKKDNIVTTTIMEHHSNFVPWQVLTQQTGARLEVIDIDNNYEFKVQSSKFRVAIQNSKLLAITHVSNVLGAVNPIKQIVKITKEQNPEVRVLVDGAQSIPHMKVDVQNLDCDFFAFSGHKMMAATGIGVLYIKKEVQKEMNPFLFGGGMIREVGIGKTIFAESPRMFEAGTPDIAGIISLGSVIEYLNYTGIENIQKHEKELTKYCLEEMKKIGHITVYGHKDARHKTGVISFNVDGVHAHDTAQILADINICVRSGHHCAMPLHERLNIPASVRVSFYLYNDKNDIDKLIEGLRKVKKIFNV